MSTGRKSPLPYQHPIVIKNIYAIAAFRLCSTFGFPGNVKTSQAPSVSASRLCATDYNASNSLSIRIRTARLFATFVGCASTKSQVLRSDIGRRIRSEEHTSELQSQ